MWCGTFGASWRGSVANTVQLSSLAFTIAVCATMSFADTRLYEGDCDSTNTFKDPNTGETFCYRIARISAEDFKIYKTDGGCRIARSLCEKDTRLRFGGVQRKATIVTINSALENEFVRNFVLAEFSKLSNTERELAIPKVLLGEKVTSFWFDGSDNSYLEHRLGNHTLDRDKCSYMSTVTRGWSVESCISNSSYEKPYNKFSFIVCKARFKVSIDGFAVATLGKFRYDCVHTSEFADGDIVHNETFCYNVTIRPISKGSDYYDKLKRVCEKERSFVHHGEVKPGFLLTLNLEEEDRFVHEVLVKPFLASRMVSVQKRTNGGLLLGAEGKGWTDGSNSALLHERYPDYYISSTSCRFLSLVPDRKWIVDKCPPSWNFELNVCKARFNVRTTTTTTTGITKPKEVTENEMQTDEEYDMQRQYTGLWKPRRGGALSATLSAVVAVTLVLLLLVNADVF